MNSRGWLPNTLLIMTTLTPLEPAVCGKSCSESCPPSLWHRSLAVFPFHRREIGGTAKLNVTARSSTAQGTDSVLKSIMAALQSFCPFFPSPPRLETRPPIPYPGTLLGLATRGSFETGVSCVAQAGLELRHPSASALIAEIKGLCSDGHRHTTWLCQRFLPEPSLACGQAGLGSSACLLLLSVR